LEDPIRVGFLDEDDGVVVGAGVDVDVDADDGVVGEFVVDVVVVVVVVGLAAVFSEAEAETEAGAAVAVGETAAAGEATTRSFTVHPLKSCGMSKPHTCSAMEMAMELVICGGRFISCTMVSARMMGLDIGWCGSRRNSSAMHIPFSRILILIGMRFWFGSSVDASGVGSVFVFLFVFVFVFVFVLDSSTLDSDSDCGFDSDTNSAPDLISDSSESSMGTRLESSFVGVPLSTSLSSNLRFFRL